MKRRTGLIFIMLLGMTLAFSVGTSADKFQKKRGKSHVSGHVIVKFRGDALEGDKWRARGLVSGSKGRKLKRSRLEKIHLPPGWDEERAVEILMRDPAVESVQVDHRVELLSAPVLLGVMPTVVPNDSSIGQQWYIDSPPLTDMFLTSTNIINVDVDIDAPEAWAVMAGMSGFATTAVVGVIDSGCGESGTFDSTSGYDPGHIDLPNSILFANTSELPADGSDSADANSLSDDANGWDFADADNTPADAGTSYHGTLISGIIGAAWDNGLGIAGIGRSQLEILPLRFIDSFFDVIAAVEYAMDLVDDGHAVRVLNMSFKSENGIDPNGLFEVVQMAQGYGIAVVAAAGNDNGNNNDDFLNRVWPAEYTRDPSISNVLAVAATGTDGSLTGFSNIGPNSVQIAAPGDSILSTYSDSIPYVWTNGTSFSTPIAGAALGLVMAAHPGLSPSEAISRVVKGGDYDHLLAGLVQSGKRVNLAGALAPFAPYSGLAYLDTTVTVSMYADTTSATYGTMVSWVSDPAFSTSPDAAVIVSGVGGSWAISPLEPGIAQFTLAFNGSSAPVGTYDTGPWRVTAIWPFSEQVWIGESVTFQSLLPAITGTVSWSVMDTTVATINSGGVLTGLSEGMTRVILSVNGVEKDISGWILVQSSSAFSSGSSGGGCGGCGTTTRPGDPYLPGLLEMMLVGMMLMLVRKRFRTALSPESMVQSPEKISL